MKIYNNIKQGTEEWKVLRKGIITGTKLKWVASAPTTATYKTLMLELIAEDLWPVVEIFQNDAMLRWIMLEPIARELYEKKTNQKVDELGFCIHDTMKFLGLSPDWFIEIDWEYKKWVEIKCPGTKNHIKYIMENKLPSEYKWQVVNYFLVNEKLEELDFITFNPDMYVEHLKMFIINIKRSDLEKKLKEIVPKLEVFQKLWQQALILLTSKNEAPKISKTWNKGIKGKN